MENAILQIKNFNQQKTVMSMLVLIGEVYYYKKKIKTKDANSSELFTKKIQPFENKEKTLKNSILLGPGTFQPADKKSRLSIISVYPRD